MMTRKNNPRFTPPACASTGGGTKQTIKPDFSNSKTPTPPPPFLSSLRCSPGSVMFSLRSYQLCRAISAAVFYFYVRLSSNGVSQPWRHPGPSRTTRPIVGRQIPPPLPPVQTPPPLPPSLPVYIGNELTRTSKHPSTNHSALSPTPPAQSTQPG